MAPGGSFRQALSASETRADGASCWKDRRGAQPRRTPARRGCGPTRGVGAGRITSFTETKDDRYLITLTGVCRFDVVDELPVMNGYRRVVASYDRYRGDLEGESASGIDCDRLLAALEAYLKVKDFQADWDAIDQTPDECLVTALAMTCPFAPSEKQVLLESPNLIERSRVMTTLFEMAALDRGGESQLRH